MSHDDTLIQTLKWEEAYPLIQQVNPKLAEVIQEINPDNRYPLIKASYSFGDMIIKDGVLQLPYATGQELPISDDRFDTSLRKQLLYSPIPLTLLLNKCGEVFLHNDARTTPLNILKPGELFGTFETIDFLLNKKSFPLWNFSAGSRSIFMLPKINESLGIKRLYSHYHLSFDTQLRCFTDHWKVFKQIASHHSWKSEVLFFTQEWFTKRADPTWSKFYDFLFTQGWGQAQSAITELKVGPFWRECIKSISHRKIKLTPYLIDTVKHLLTITMGLVPAQRPTHQSELEAPVAELQRSFVDIYQLLHHLPTVMIPEKFNLDSELPSPVYYSLSFPTLSDSSSLLNTAGSFMLDLKTIKFIMDGLVRHHKNNPHMQKIRFEYFHIEKDKFNEISESALIPDSDRRFLLDKNKFPDRTFCSTSPFWRGCIKISANQQ